MITFLADIREARAITDDAITTSSVGIPVNLRLSPAFDGLAVTVCFRAGSTAVDLAIPNASPVVCPPDVLTTAGNRLKIGVYAANGSGTIVIPTVWADVGIIKEGTIPSGVDPSEPTPSWVAQVQNIASLASENAASALEKATEVETAANNGDFDGRDGFSPTVTVTDITGGHRVLITDAIGTNIFNVMDGSMGPQGPIGLTGPQGAKGDKGDKGDTGEIGPKGETGDTGPQGAKGDKGDKGDTGAQGPQGIQGETGPTGPQGEKGDKGDKGDTGAQGPQGIQGETGPKGDKGDKGDTGAKGDKGDKGDTGNTGATPAFSIGTVTTLSPGQDATASIGGTAESPTLSLGIPQGATGEAGGAPTASIAPTFSNATAYSAGDYVYHSGTLYVFTADHAAGDWTGSDATAAVIGDDASDLKSQITTGEILSKFYQGARSAGNPAVINTNANRCTSDVFRMNLHDAIRITGLKSGQKYAIAALKDDGTTYDSGWETYTTRVFTPAFSGKVFINIATSAGNTPISPSDLTDLKLEFFRADLEWLKQPNWYAIDQRLGLNDGYVDYGYVPFHMYSQHVPYTNAYRYGEIGAEQRNTFTKINIPNPLTGGCYVGVNNHEKSAAGTATGQTVLTAGHIYEVSVNYISGVISAYPSISVYKYGGTNTIGSGERLSDGKSYKRTFTAEQDEKYTFGIYLYTGTTATDAVFQVLLKDVTEERGVFGGEIDATVASVRALQTEPCICFPLVTDIHYGVSESGDDFLFRHKTIENIREVLSQIRADCSVNLGDVTNGNSANTEAYAATVNNLFRSLDVPYILAIGNHDDNRYRTGYTFTDAQMYAYYTAFSDNAVVFNDDTNGRDYYIDFSNYNVRFVVLDSNTGGAYGFNNDTVTWFTNVALDTPAGCQVVVLVHESPISSQNYNNASLTNGSDISNAIEAYQTGGKSIIQLYGHSHVDVAFTSPYLSIGTNCNKFENTNGDPEKWPSGATKPARVMGEVSEDCWDMVVLRPLSKKIDFVRFGAGNDRSYTYA